MHVLKELKHIEKVSGSLTPESVVDAARDPLSPLHNRFCWDDGVAAEAYRRQQAITLIGTVKVFFENKHLQAFHNVTVKVGTEQRGVYLGLNEILSDSDLHDQVLERALGELNHWQTKYETLNELKSVINTSAMEELEKKLG